MGLRSIEYRGLRPLKLGLSLPAGIYEVPETVADQIEAAAPLSVGDVPEESAPSTPAAESSDEGLSGLSKKALYALAQEAEIPGRSGMDKDALLAALSDVA